MIGLRHRRHRPASRRLAIGLLLGCLLLPAAGGARTLADLVKDDGRTLGSATAPITLIEYSDFTCGFCQKWAKETLPKIHAKYIETGKLRFLYKDFPRAFGGPAMEGALASRCAADQQRYWAMHDRLFAERRLGPEELQQHAKTLGLDAAGFAKCMHEAKQTDDIFRDRAEGASLGFHGTPGFVLMRTVAPEKSQPVVIPGAFPFEVFEEQIDKMLGDLSKKKG